MANVLIFSAAGFSDVQPTSTLRTTRLLLRPIVAADADSLFPLFSDDDTMRWWSSGPFRRVADFAAWLTRGDGIGWAVCLDAEPVGRIDLIERRPHVAEIGYLLAREHWGRGLAREAITAVIEQGFGPLGLRRIFADTDPDNAASVGVLAALGFVFEGRLREEWETHIGVRDSLIFGLLRDEWAKRPR